MFRFTIRDVLLATVIVGLALGWGLDHRLLTLSGKSWKWCAELLANHFKDQLGSVQWNDENSGFESRKPGADGVGVAFPGYEVQRPDFTFEK